MSKKLIEAEILYEKLVIKLKKKEDDEEADEIRDFLDVVCKDLSLNEMKLLKNHQSHYDKRISF